MICKVCGSTKWLRIRQYNKPDKYESYVGIGPPVCRRWMRCLSCGLYQAFRSYPLEKLLPIYTDGYRSGDFRGETIEETFQRIVDLPPEESENVYRIRWLTQRISRCSLLDIGSGFGIFPYVMKLRGYASFCIEPNEQSSTFIQKHLGLPCLPEFFANTVYEPKAFDCVSVIHVLEHIEDPESFLVDVKKVLKPDGKLFVEVPDAVEFDYLSDGHDEFNSCHTLFFDVPTLYRLVEYSGFKVKDVHRVHHEKRNLSRILMLAEVLC